MADQHALVDTKEKSSTDRALHRRPTKDLVAGLSHRPSVAEEPTLLLEWGAMFWAMKTSRSALVALTILCLSTLGSAADNKSAARSLATEAQNAFSAGEYQKAVDFLEKAERQFHAPTHLLLMAMAHMEMGQLVQAEERLYTIVNEPLGESAPQAFISSKTQASELLETLKSRIPNTQNSPSARFVHPRTSWSERPRNTPRRG
jgi:hypothetical protein